MNNKLSFVFSLFFISCAVCMNDSQPVQKGNNHQPSEVFSQSSGDRRRTLSFLAMLQPSDACRVYMSQYMEDPTTKSPEQELSEKFITSGEVPYPQRSHTDPILESKIKARKRRKKNEERDAIIEIMRQAAVEEEREQSGDDIFQMDL